MFGQVVVVRKGQWGQIFKDIVQREFAARGGRRQMDREGNKHRRV